MRELLVALWLLPGPFSTAFGQQLAVLGPEPGVVRVGEQSVVTLVLDGAPPGAVPGPLPTIDGLEIRPGRAVHSSVETVVAGRVVERPRVTWPIVLCPVRAGVFAVPELSFEAESGALAARPFRLEALAETGGAESALLEVETQRDRVFLHEQVVVRVRFGFEERFLREHLIELSSQRLDVPARLVAGWLEELPGAISLGAAAGGAVASGGMVSIATNDSPAVAPRRPDRMVDGKRFRMFEVGRSFLANATGELVIPGAALRFAYATEFVESLLAGRVPADRREGAVACHGTTVSVLPLPAEARPPDYGGAVGRFTLRAVARPERLAVGESLKLVIVIEGEGNLGFFEPPALDGLTGFHVFGKIDDRASGHRTVTVDLTPLSESVREVPELSLPYFDPAAPAGYRVARTAPIVLDVLPRADGARFDPEAGIGQRPIPGVSDIHELLPRAAGSGAAARREPALLLIGMLLFPWFAGGGLLVWMRSRERAKRDPDGVRARHAAAAFRARTGRTAARLDGAFAGYLAARLRCPDAAVIAPDLAARLLAAGVSRDLADRAAALLDRLVAARYGGGACAAGLSTARETVAELEESFLAAEAEP